MPKYKFSEIAYNINQKKMPEPGDEEMYIGLEHLDSGSLKVKRWGSDVPITGEKLVMKKGDILFGRRNTYLRRAAIAPHDGIFSAHGMIFRPNTAVMDEDYFPFFISSDYFMNAAIRISVGSLSPTVNWKTLKELEFDIPDLESQRKSAELLTAANRLKEAYEILLEETDQLVKSQFIELFGDGEIDQSPWPKAIMEDIFAITSSRRILKSEWKTEGSIPFIRVRDMVQLANKEPLNNEFFVTEEFYSSRPDEEKVIPGDIIVSATSTIGKTYIIKPGERFYFKDADVLLFRKKQPINEVFFTYGLTQPTMWDQISGGLGATTVAHFLISKACKLIQPLPPMELQERFAMIAQQSDKSKFEIKQSIKNITEVINSLLQQDFNI